MMTGRLCWSEVRLPKCMHVRVKLSQIATTPWVAAGVVVVVQCTMRVLPDRMYELCSVCSIPVTLNTGTSASCMEG